MDQNTVTRRSVIIGAAALAATPPALSQNAPGPGTGSRRFDLERFVDDITTARADTEPQSATEDVLRRAVGQPGDVLHALGEPSEAGITTLHRSTNLTILNVIWAPLMILLPHNHNMWATIGIYTGREDNILWDRRAAHVTAAGAVSLSAKQVFSLSDTAIHSVTNPIRQMTGAIHIYGGDFFAPGRSEWDPQTLQERPWDIAAARDEFREASDRFGPIPHNR